ncbi:MAG: glycerol-3-phosphate 1-O-acyltransferase PlsY [Fibrobacteres bacterium]|nr:glycerol-3-phosphate 1-O-acyltransferase PlsY [Fibrobacterota bacterium]
MFTALTVLVICYLLGSIPTSIIVCKKLKNIDIREHGSGNAGATNVYRVMGLKVALFVLAIDALKGAVAVIVAKNMMWSWGDAAGMFGGLIAILGHIWTVFAEFKGGKGIGPALGVFIALLPFQAAISLGGWIFIVYKTKTVSIASISAGFLLFLSTLITHVACPESTNIRLVIFTFLVAVLIVVTHRKNIGRIMAGTENKLTFGKKDSNE